MIWRPLFHKRLAQLADFLTTAASFVVAYFLWDWLRTVTQVARPIPLGSDTVLKIIGLSLVWIFGFSKQNAYSYQRFSSIKAELKIVARTTILGVFTFFGAFFLFRFGYVSRLYIVVFGVVNFLLLAVEKIALIKIANLLRRKGLSRIDIIIVGTGDRAGHFITVAESQFSWRLRIIGLITGDPGKVGKEFHGYRVLGTSAEIESVLHAHPVDEVVICVSTKRFDQIRDILECCEREGVQVRLYSDFFGKIAKKVRVDHVYGLPIISFITTPDQEFPLYVKRIMDILVSATLLILLSPLFFIVALLVKRTSQGSVFYRWEVIGLNKKPFTSWKFRTMVTDADRLKPELLEKNIMTGPAFKMKDDPRVTKVGKWLRKYSLDELPQLWSVFKGDMSLVGPRPAGPDELERYESWHRRKLSIKPGLTCLWQISGRNEISDFDEWVGLDLQYIENWSLWLDLKILLKTIPAIAKGTGY